MKRIKLTLEVTEDGKAPVSLIQDYPLDEGMLLTKAFRFVAQRILNQLYTKEKRDRLKD